MAATYHLSRLTVAKWRQRKGTEDGSHRPNTLHANLSPAQEAVVLALRESLLLPLDDLLAVTHEFINPDVSRSGLSRCLRRHRVPRLKELRLDQQEADRSKHKPFQDYEPGFIHFDLK